LAGKMDRMNPGLNSSTGETEPTYTFTIVTTDACKSLEWLHDRQPVILHTQSDLDDWLSPSPRWSKRLEKITEPYSGPELECYRVPNEVGRVGTESPAYLEPISKRKDGIEAMFGKQKEKAKALKEEDSKEAVKPTTHPQGASSQKVIDLEKDDAKQPVANFKRDASSSGLGSKSSPSTPVKKRPGSNTKSPSPQKKRKTTKDEGVKLTSFFSKKETG